MAYTEPDEYYNVEVRTTGDDLNGGCFVAEREGMTTGVDRSQADSPYLQTGVDSVTFTTVAGATDTARKSYVIANHTVSSDDVGNFVNTSVGATDVHVGMFCIESVDTGANTWVMSQYVRDSGADAATPTSVTARMGGAWPSVCSFKEAAVLTTRMAISWVRSGTYALTTTSDNVSGGVYVGHWSQPAVFVGYESERGDNGTRPIFTTGETGLTSYMMYIQGYRGSLVANIEFNGGSTAGNAVHFGNWQGAVALNCKAVNFDTSSGGAFQGKGTAVGCEVDGARYGYRCGALDCVATDCSEGFYPTSYSTSIERCVAYDCTTGFYCDAGGGAPRYCTADDCTTGFHVEMPAICCIASNCGTGYTGGSASGTGLVECARYNNTTNASGMGFDSNGITCTSDPYVDQNSRDYRINTDAGGGALLADEGFRIPGQTNYSDLGAVITEPSGGGSSVIPARPIQIGA